MCNTHSTVIHITKQNPQEENKRGKEKQKMMTAGSGCGLFLQSHQRETHQRIKTQTYSWRFLDPALQSQVFQK